VLEYWSIVLHHRGPLFIFSAYIPNSK